MRAAKARDIRAGIWFARHCANATGESKRMRTYYFVVGSKNLSRIGRRAARRTLNLP